MKLPWRKQVADLISTPQSNEVPASSDGAITVSPDKVGGAVLVSPEYASDVSRRYLDAVEASREATQRVKDVEDEIKNTLGAHAELAEEGTGRVLFSWAATLREVLDSKRLSAERPEIAQEYRRTSASRTFRQHVATKATKYASSK